MYNQIVHFVELQPNCEEVKVVAYCKVFLGLSTSRAKEMIDDLVTVGKLSRTQDKKLVAIKTLFREP
jgi:polyhydroxyalkanoate synthesis regulator phasin